MTIDEAMESQSQARPNFCCKLKTKLLLFLSRQRPQDEWPSNCTVSHSPDTSSYQTKTPLLISLKPIICVQTTPPVQGRVVII